MCKFLLTIVLSEEGKTTITKPLTFWKWKHISDKDHILKMKAHSETHFENENTLMGKWGFVNDSAHW